MRYPNSFKFTHNFSERRKKLVLLVVVLVVILAALLLFKTIFDRPIFLAGENLLSDERFELPRPHKSLSLNKEFTFPLKDDQGEEVDQIKYIIEKAEIRDQIIVSGKKATSVKGRTFLIINVKIVNDFSKAIQINARDYVRLIVNNNDSEALAPDIHNDPVEVQAISTKYTRVGFPVDDNTQSLNLRVGEINGEKQVVDLSF